MVWFLRRRARDVRVPGKVVVFGASSRVGQTLSLLLKTSPHVQELVCCDTSRGTTGAAMSPSSLLSSPLCGVVADLAHIDSTQRVWAALSPDDWPAALHGAQLILVCGNDDCVDLRRRDRDVALQATAPALRPVMHTIAAHARSAVVALACEPLNALVPLCAEWLRAAGAFDPRKLLGVTALDVHRTRCLLAAALQRNPYDLNVTVVGGRGGCTVCPVLAQTRLQLPLGAAQRIAYTVQHTGQPYVTPVAHHDHTKDDTHDASASSSSSLVDTMRKTDGDNDDGASGDAAEDSETAAAFASAVLTASNAYYDWAMSVLKALRGDYGITECALVESTVRAETAFFASRVRLGREGVEELLPVGTLSSSEHELVERAAAAVARDVRSGLDYYAATERCVGAHTSA